MMDWMRKLDDRLFSPPHTFQTVLAFIVVRLSLVFDEETEHVTIRESEKAEEPQGPSAVAEAQ